MKAVISILLANVSGLLKTCGRCAGGSGGLPELVG